jgi:predicted thioesterase
MTGYAHCEDAQGAMKEVSRLIEPMQKQGYEFRAEMWSGELKADVGRAVRVQLFKGLDYRFCVSAAAGSKVKISAMVLDFDGKPMGTSSRAEDGHAVILAAQPRRTGLYVIAMRQENGVKDATCAMVTGWK